MAKRFFKCRDKKIDVSGGPIVMGILNVTPNSFSDGGQFKDSQAAIDTALEMVEQGAAIIDVGGESTRPGSKSVSPAEQIKRVAPVIAGIVKATDVPVSIDTMSAEVAEVAIDVGAVIVNDISALGADESMAAMCGDKKVGVILMHMLGKPNTMQDTPEYTDVIKNVQAFLLQRISVAVQMGIARDAIVLDPGIGFGKKPEHNLKLIQEISSFHQLGFPLMVGLSRKSFIGKVLDIEDPNLRMVGTIAAHTWCVAGNVQILRAHDVAETIQTAKMIHAIGAAE
jgi:dihydropteroate synthase